MVVTNQDFVTALEAWIAERVGIDRFAVWFQDQVTFQYESDTLSVMTPDEFGLEQVRRRFGDLICESIRQLADRSISLEWKVTSVVNAKPDSENPGRLPTKANLAQRPDGAVAHLRDSSELRSDRGASQDDAAGPGGATVQRDATVTRATTCKSVSPTAPSKANASSGERPRFESFVSGERTRLAYSAAMHVPQKLGDVSPLFLYGPTGVGKTHLLHAIYSKTRRSTRARCVMVTSEQFTSGFLEALHGRGLPSFRRKFRNTDLLILDDIQFFVGKRATLVELLYTVDALVQDGRQIVMASDRPPNELNGVGSEIIARLSAGLTCGLDYPERDTKLELVRHLAQRRGEALSDDVMRMIADELPGDARRIKGAINRLAAMRLALGQEITVTLATRELGDLFQSNQRPLAMIDIERAVCEVFGVEDRVLRSEKKTKTVSQPRMLAMWLARKHTNAAYSEIGEYFGGRSHSTVISAHHKVDRWVDENSNIAVACGSSSVHETIRRIELNLRAVS